MGRRFGLVRLGVLIGMLFCWAPMILIAQERQRLHDDLFSVTFSNGTEGWACGRWGCILHTADGGKSWTRQKSGTHLTLSSIIFVDSQKGWAVGDQGIILHTGDGGKTWEKQKGPVSLYLMNVFFITPLRGWIVTERTHILSTEDGGRTWRIQFHDEDFILKAVSFCDPLHGWAVGEYGYIYHTLDGGVTWRKQAGFYKISDETGEIEGGNYLFDVVAIDPKTVWAVGIDGYVTCTRDGGRTWKEVVTRAPKVHLLCVSSDKKDKILIGGEGVFLSSSDQGRTWKTPEFTPAITYGWIGGIAHRGSSGFVAVGWEGAIYLSASDRWQQVLY